MLFVGMFMGAFAMIRMFMIMRTMISCMIMAVLICLPFVGMRMTVFMGMAMCVQMFMLMLVFCAIMLVRMLMLMRMIMIVFMTVFVLAFHCLSPPFCLKHEI